MRTLLMVMFLIALAEPVFGQAPPPPPSPGTITPGSPGFFVNNPHPAMPNEWNTYSPIHWGTIVDQVWIPPEPVAIQVYVRQPEGIPEVWQTQIVEVPGYYVVRTTKGTVYPERWTLDQTGPGIYQWRKLPPYFQSR